MATLAELGDRLCEEVGLPRFSAAGRAQGYIFEAYCDAVQRARLNPASYLLSLTAGQSDYDLATVIPGFVMLRSVLYTPISTGVASDGALEQIAPIDARLALSTSRTVPGYTTGYALEGNTLILVPAPTASADTALLDYDAQPASFNADQEPPLLPTHLHNALVWGGLTRDTENHDIQRKTLYQTLWKQGMGEIVRWASRRQGQRPRTAVLGGRRRYAVPNDVYLRDC
jgi:hypothetical protein